MMITRMLFDDYFKVMRVIESCKTLEQLTAAETCCELFLSKWKEKRKTLPFAATAIELIFGDAQTYQTLYYNLQSKLSFRRYVLKGN